MKLTRTTLYSLLLLITCVGLGLVGWIGLRYRYSTLTTVESGIGFVTLLIVAAILALYRQQARRNQDTTGDKVLLLGLALGLIWMIEISINNFIAPPLPARDIIDDILWAIISFVTLFFAVKQAYRENRFGAGVTVGIWSGFVSGLVACFMALLVIAFGMHFILQDPLNIAEWSVRAATTDAPNMATYFAFETFAGAFAHLILIGVIFGMLLGMFGAGIGKGIKRITR
ncbi:MAG: hypothetical protein U0175_03680 [Caldilineaceae bacterium]